MAAEQRSRRWIWIVLLICVAIFAYNLIADRLTPYSSQATVQAYIVSVAPEVAGTVVEIGVIDNQIVKEGDLLFRLDPQAYEVAVREALRSDRGGSRSSSVDVRSSSPSALSTSDGGRAADTPGRRGARFEVAGRADRAVVRAAFPPRQPVIWTGITAAL